MKISWLGHASFLIESNGMRIITDPYDVSVGYRVLGLEADLVTVSHSHYDHNAVDTVKGQPVIVAEPGPVEQKGVKVRGVPTFHDKDQGRQRGANLVFVISTENLVVCHLGDLGHLPTRQQLTEMGPVDVLLIPVGGNYTIDAKDAVELVGMIKPQIAIPMHFKTPDVTINLAPVEEFLQHFDKAVKIPYLEVTKENIASLPRIVVLDYQGV